MVAVPNIVGLTQTQAVSALSAVSLNYSVGADVTTEVVGLDTLVESQDPASGTLVQYESPVTFRLYHYVPPAFSFTPSFSFTPAFSFTPTFSFTPPFSFSAFGGASFNFTPAPSFTFSPFGR